MILFENVVYESPDGVTFRLVPQFQLGFWEKFPQCGFRFLYDVLVPESTYLKSCFEGLFEILTSLVSVYLILIEVSIPIGSEVSSCALKFLKVNNKQY